MLTRIGDLAAARPKRTLLALLVFLLVAGVLGGPVAGLLKSSGGFVPADANSQQAIDRIEATTGRQIAPGVVLLVDTPQGASTPAAQRRLAALQRSVAAQPGIVTVSSRLTSRDTRYDARDGRSTLVAATVAAGSDEEEVAGQVLTRFAGRRDVTVGGAAVGQKQVGDAVGADLGRAEGFAFPILIVLSLVFFRGRRAAALPLLVGITTILGTFLALRAVNEAYGLSVFALNLVIGLGLGLAIDYTLFLVTRYREELGRHGVGGERQAIRATMSTAGRTVAFSAATVAIALVTLVVFPLNFLQSMGIAGAVVAVVAALAALIISPALFMLWGRKLMVKQRGEARPPEAGRWYRLSKAVMRRPGTIAAVTAALMLVVALPSLRAVWTPVDDTVIPKGQSARIVADRVNTDFAGQDTTPVVVAVEGARGDGAGVAAYAAGLRALPGVRTVGAPRALDDSTWQVDVAVKGAPEGPLARQVVESVRARGGEYPVLVAGAAAEFVDQQAAISDALPLAIGLLVILTFAVLWLMAGSVVLPAKAIVMNVLTVGASLGVLTFIFQDGRLEGLLNYTGNGGVEPTDFLVSAALVFALSTDYGVFLLGRIREARASGLGEREAVAVGLERTGAVVTAAAILLAVAIGAFVTSSISFIQQVGVATASGVLIDAFIVRSLLVPSLMGLLGKWNWWSPMVLRRLHDRIGLAEGAAGAPQTA